MYDPRLLDRAAREGRVRGKAVELLEGVFDRAKAPGSVLSQGLRQAKHLHSRERRMVADGVREVIRHRGVLAEATGAGDPMTLWMAWLVTVGLAPEAAALVCEGVDFSGLTDVRVAGARLAEGRSRAGQVALLGSVDDDVAEALVDSLGDRVFTFIEASNARADVLLRVNTLCADVAQAQEVLASDDIITEPCALAPLGLRVVGRANVAGSNAVRRGMIEIQDEGSQLLVELVRPTGRVVDYCAGAGGKTLALAALAPDARLMALDVRIRALDELRKRARRAEVHGVTVGHIKGDTLPKYAADWQGTSDRVLVDAPCSGTGTLRRHPEHRLRLDGAELDRLRPLQLRILRSAATLVAPGGELIYATCSVLRRENEDVVEAFLRTAPDFEQIAVSALLGTERAAQVGDGEVLRLTPNEHGTDGFFGAVLRRRT